MEYFDLNYHIGHVITNGVMIGLYQTIKFSNWKVSHQHVVKCVPGWRLMTLLRHYVAYMLVPGEYLWQNLVSFTDSGTVIFPITFIIFHYTCFHIFAVKHIVIQEKVFCRICIVYALFQLNARCPWGEAGTTVSVGNRSCVCIIIVSSCSQ